MGKEKEEFMIKLENISKTFAVKDRTVEAVKNVSIEINDGEIYGIIGFSGAGKSTLVRCINLLEHPTSGKVFVGGEELTALSEGELRKVRRKIGMIFQQFNLMASRNVERNIALPLENTGMSKEQIKTRVKELLDYVGLSDKGKSYPSQLSGGQKQRVAIARALANKPDVLLCDEATSALDNNSEAIVQQAIENLMADRTVFVIAHRLSTVRHADKIVVINYGQIVESGTHEELLAHENGIYASLYQAQLK